MQQAKRAMLRQLEAPCAQAAKILLTGITSPHPSSLPCTQKITATAKGPLGLLSPYPGCGFFPGPPQNPRFPHGEVPALAISNLRPSPILTFTL